MVCFVVLCLCVDCLNVLVWLFVDYCVIVFGVLFVMLCGCCVVGVCVVRVIECAMVYGLLLLTVWCTCGLNINKCVCLVLGLTCDVVWQSCSSALCLCVLGV